MPLVAVTVLHATPGEVGLLATLSTVAFLVIGLPAGAWTDRLRRRGVLVVADVARAVVLCSVPVAWWLGVLHIGQLYAVVLLCGIGTVFFEVARQSYVPSVVGRPALLAANTRLVLVDAVSYLLSAWCVPRVRHREPAPARTDTLVGSLVARRLAVLVGAGRLVLVSACVAAPCGFGMPFIAEETWLAGAGWGVVTAVVGVNNVVLVSFRQAVTPDQLLGRMTASFQFLLMGALAAGATAIALVWVPILASPLRKARDLA